MDKWQAQHYFWSSFGVNAYEEHSVPDDRKKTDYPRITYEAATSTFENIVSITASIWTRSTSWAAADGIANAIEFYIKNQGRKVTINSKEVAIPECIPIDGGYLRVFIGDTTFAQRMDDPEDDQIKRIIVNVQFEFMTD